MERTRVEGVDVGTVGEGEVLVGGGGAATRAAAGEGREALIAGPEMDVERPRKSAEVGES